MKVLLVLVILSNIILGQNMKYNIMPWPREINSNEGKLPIDSTFSIICQITSKRIETASNRFLRRVSNRTGIFLSNPYMIKKGSATLHLQFNLSPRLSIKNDESYSLTITEKEVLLEANTDIGILRGLETIFQLISVDSTGYYIPSVQIEDLPRFVWRGLMIDVARHFMPVDLIKRNIDGMASVKLNVLHLHLTDDQGFRVESKLFPELHSKNLDGNYYTQTQICDIIEYADLRGIRIIPEFDIPAHVTSWLHVKPELGSSGEPYDWQDKWGVFDATFDPTLEDTYKFFEEFFGEMKSLFPDEYIHIGGDENTGKEWDSNEKIQIFMKNKGIKTNKDLQIYFISKIHEIIKSNEKVMIGWDEILDDLLDREIIVQSWRSKEIYKKSIDKGFKTILSRDYYLDLMYDTKFHFLNDPIDTSLGITSEQESLVLGGEAPMWSELVTPENIDSRIWPRTAAIAERFWSPAGIRDVEFMYERLGYISYLLEEHGLTHLSFRKKMLRRLTNNECTKALDVFIGAVKPLEEYGRLIDGRNRGMSFGQASPYTRVMDVVVADPQSNRKFNNAVERFLSEKNEADYNFISAHLKLWIENHHNLKMIFASSPILKEVEILSLNLSLLAELGLDNLQILYGNKVEISFDDNEMKHIIDESALSYGQIKISVRDAILKIINNVNK